MKLSPLELRKHNFAKKFRLSGYDPDEVNGFIRQMADQWSEVLEENRRLEERTRELEGKLTHYEKVELALQEALETARHTARQVEDNAERKANITIEEAELRAQQMLQDAEQERYGIKQDLVKLNSRQSEIAARMRAFLMAEMEVLAQFQGDDPIGFIRLESAKDAGPKAMLSERVAQLDSTESEASLDDLADVEEDEPVEDAQTETIEEEVASDEPVVSNEPAPVVEPTFEPVVGAEPVVKEAAAELEDDMPYPSPAVPPPPPPVVRVPPIAKAVPPPPPPVEEPVVMPPAPEPAGLPSVEELIAQTPPPPPPTTPKPTVEVDDGDSRPTYRDMLSGSQPAVEEESTDAPFSSSFFKSPFADAEKPGETDAKAAAQPAADSGQSWSLRSLVTGDGDSEPTSSSPSDAERERIRRILEDLD